MNSGIITSSIYLVQKKENLLLSFFEINQTFLYFRMQLSQLYEVLNLLEAHILTFNILGSKVVKILGFNYHITILHLSI